MVIVFATGPEYMGSIPGRIISKILKWYLMSSCFRFWIITYKSKVIGAIQENGVEPLLSSLSSSHWKGSLQVALNYIQVTYEMYTIIQLFDQCSSQRKLNRKY